MKKVLIVSVFLFLGISGFSITYVTKPGQYAALADCSHLSDKEQRFARQLSALHRDLFCKRFNENQRGTAMRYAERLNGRQPEDMAVEKVLEEAREQPEVEQHPESSYYNSPCYRKHKK